MSCVPYNWEHMKGKMVPAFCTCYHSPQVSTSCQTWVLQGSHLFSCRLLPLPLLHVKNPIPDCESWRGCWNDLCRWLCASYLPNPCHICHWLSWTVPCFMLYGEPMSMMCSFSKWQRKSHWVTFTQFTASIPTFLAQSASLRYLFLFHPRSSPPAS